MKITTLSQAIDLLNNGKIQISCRSAKSAEEVCDIVPEAVNTYSPISTYLWQGQGSLIFSGPHPTIETLSAKRFLALPKDGTKKISEMPQVQRPINNDVLQVRTPTLDGGWCVKNDGSEEFKKVMKQAVPNNDWNFLDVGSYYGIGNDGNFRCEDKDYLYHFNSNIIELPELKELIGYREESMKVVESMKKATEATNNLASVIAEPTPEQLLAKCKEMYPIGTKYYSITEKKEFIAKQEPQFWFYDKSKIYVTALGGFIYADGKFAEIISLPEQRKIIGYLAPMDMYTTGNNIPVKKGTFGIKDFDNYCYSFNGWLFPAELVEAYFTPKYAETEADLITELINDFINHSNGQSLETFSKSQNKFTIKRK